WQGKRIEELNKCTEHKQTRELPVQDGSRKEDRSGKLQGSLSSKRTSEGVRVQGSLSQYRAKKEEKGRQSQDSGKSSQPVKSKEFDYNAYYKKVELEKYKNFVNGACSPSNHIKNYDDHHDHRYARYYKVNGEYKILHKMKYLDVGCLDTGSRPGKKKLLEMQKFRDEVMAAKLFNLYHNHIRIIEKRYVNNRLNEEKDDLSYNIKYCFDHEWYGISYEHGCDLVKNTLERAGKAWLRMHERRIEERLRQMKLEEMKQQPAPEVVDPST